MKKCLIYVEIFKSPEFQFTKSITEEFKKNNSDVLVFDFDNFSEPSTIMAGVKLMDEMDRVAIVIKSEEGGNTYALLKFFEQILIQKQKVSIYLQNPSPVLLKMFDIKGMNCTKNQENPRLLLLLSDYFDA